MCGPLLKYAGSVDSLNFKSDALPSRYDTVDDYGIWHGAALVVSESPFNPFLEFD
jgi:hypothetical protein